VREIKVVRATPEKLAQLGVDGWSPWECSPETFDWEYSSDETAYVKEGLVKVRTEYGQEVELGAGDLVFFPRGLKCTWTVVQTIRKVYIFDKPL
jgi:uncharacterized protein